MPIDLNTIDHLASLAKLEFTEEEKLELKADLENITAFFDKITELSTDNLVPLVYMNEDVNVLRPDEIEKLTTCEEAFANAPKSNSGFFIVPKVIKGS
ncbi:MAG: Asp-tRNA(Asn)/Glu-tRNA(Gln) amidotransferase subunit GatC [Sphingobacteriales bacterium]|nr:MAG: Asp-tRNA(Asn)/Glu-tRNA(Gln) amidotransferase subunit GatC [Sphingobacteriales bacterium]